MHKYKHDSSHTLVPLTAAAAAAAAIGPYAVRGMAEGYKQNTFILHCHSGSLSYQSMSHHLQLSDGWFDICANTCLVISVQLVEGATSKTNCTQHPIKSDIRLF